MHGEHTRPGPERCRCCRQPLPAEAYAWHRDWGRYELHCAECDRRNRFNLLEGLGLLPARPPGFKRGGEQPYTRWSSLRSGARARRISVRMTYLEFRLLVMDPCAYCGDWSPRLNLDRVDNRGAYEPDNVVPCCWACNRMKGTMTADDFLEHIRRIARHWGLT